jgi:hypothetical protein
MLVFGHPCAQCGYVGVAEPVGGGFVGCPQCFMIEDMDFNEVIDTPDFINSKLGQPIGV